MVYSTLGIKFLMQKAKPANSTYISSQAYSGSYMHQYGYSVGTIHNLVDKFAEVNRTTFVNKAMKIC